MLRKILTFILVLVLISSLGLNIKLINEKTNDRHYKDRFIKYNLASEISLLFNTLDDLDSKLFKDDKLINLNNKQIEKIIFNTFWDIFDINASISHTHLLNSEYYITLDELEDYLHKLISSLNRENRNLTPDEQNTIKELCSLAEEYHASSRISNYDDSRRFWKEMPLPENTKIFFDKINEISKKASAKIKDD